MMQGLSSVRNTLQRGVYISWSATKRRTTTTRSRSGSLSQRYQHLSPTFSDTAGGCSYLGPCLLLFTAGDPAGIFLCVLFVTLPIFTAISHYFVGSRTRRRRVT